MMSEHLEGYLTCVICGKRISPKDAHTIIHNNIPSICCSKCYTKEDKISHADNSSISFNIDGEEYNYDKVIEILKKHKAEEDKKYHKCERCGTRYLQNNTFNMVTHNLDEKPDNCSAWAYASTPYIRGFKILSTCGDGREVKLCDDCIKKLILFLNGDNIIKDSDK